MDKIRCKYGILELQEKTEEQYFWGGCSIENTNEKLGFEEQIPIGVFTKKKLIEPSLIQFIEKTLANLDTLLEVAISFLKKSLSENPTKYNLKSTELSELSLDIYNFPVDLPEINFYENNEWMIRFATGNFDICEPYGIAVFFHEDKPIFIEDLSESEIID